MARTRLSLLGKLILAGIGGFLTTFAFPAYSVWLLAPLGIAILVSTAKLLSPRAAAGAGFIWGLAFFLPHLDWADFAVGPVPWSLLAASQAGFVALAVWLWRHAVDSLPYMWRLGMQSVTFGLLWTAAEELRSMAPFGGFPWGRIAFSQAESLPGKLAWLGGVPLVTFVTVTAGAVVGVAVMRIIAGVRSAPAGLLMLPKAIVGGIVAPAILLSAGALIPLSAEAENGTLSIGAVQGNVPGKGLDAFTRERLVLNNHVEGTHNLAETGEEFDVVIWPENATDIDPEVDEQARVAIDEAAQAVDAPILVGAVQALSDSERINVSLLWEPGVGIVDTYTKQHPAPFAEYIPMRPIARLFSDEVDRVVRDMVPGEGVGMVDLAAEKLGRDVSLGDVICFEVAYDPLVRSAIDSGGELLIIQTNNATFGFTNESVQQLAMSQLRAIEHGRSTLQISTVGVSALIQPDGTIAERMGHYTAETLAGEMELRTSKTPATVIGGWVAAAFNAVGIFLVVATGAAIILRRLLEREIRKEAQTAQSSESTIEGV